MAYDNGQTISGHSPNGMPNILMTMAAPESASQIRDAIGRAEQLTQEAHQVLDRLIDRLDAALTPTANTAGTPAPTPAPAPPASDVRRRLEQLNEGLVGLQGRIAHLMNRIEL